MRKKNYDLFISIAHVITDLQFVGVASEAIFSFLLFLHAPAASQIEFFSAK
jgi:hypothetical protein